MTTSARRLLFFLCAALIVLGGAAASAPSASISLNDIVAANADVLALKAGLAKVDSTLPDSSGVGVPLAGFNHGARRNPWWPLISTGRPYCNWMEPSTGVLSPTWVKALVLDTGAEKFAFVTVDAIGMDGNLAELSYTIAAGLGFSVPRDNVIMSGSHTHSGPGAISPSFLWQFAPATDLLVPQLQRQMAENVAQALIQAENSMQSATMGFGTARLIGVTQNRRARISPYVNSGTIDPQLGVIRIDDANGHPIATVWNFAVHGVCLGPDNMKFSGDIMGRACDLVESAIGGTALFINADAGDVDPTSEACSGSPQFAGSQVMANAIVKARQSIASTSSAVDLRVASSVIPFGLTQLNITLQRFENCTSGGPLDICSICKVLRCDLNYQLDAAWIEQDPRFTAASFGINGKHHLIVTLPGEPLVELGWQVYNDTLDMGFDTTFLAGYTNNHMGYFATPNEYDIGGYESQLTFWGRNTAEMVRAGCKEVANVVKPTKIKSKN